MTLDINALREAIASDQMNAIFQAVTNYFAENPGHRLRNDFILLQSRWSEHQQSVIRGFGIDATAPAAIKHGLLGLFDRLEKDPPEPGPPPPAGPPKFVLVYDRADDAHCKALNRNLTLLKRADKIRVYNVYENFGGDVIAASEKEIETADYVLALVTANLFYSEDDWIGVLERANQAGRKVIPIRFEEVAEYSLTFFAKLAALPRSKSTVKDFAGADAAYTEIVTEIRKLL